jgi:dihydrofolate reductase
MSRLVVRSFSISIDGYGAGPNQDLANPLGVGFELAHEWLFGTRTFRQRVRAQEGGSTGKDDEFAERGFTNAGAWILGRNMFGPIRGPWPDDTWKGWWGDDPPFHTACFVLTHYARPAIVMKGGTTFHFVTEGIEAALDRAREAAKGKDVQLGGGVATVRAYMRAGLIDEMHVAIVPVLVGSGEQLFAGVNGAELGWRCTEHVAGEGAMHVVLARG